MIQQFLTDKYDIDTFSPKMQKSMIYLEREKKKVLPICVHGTRSPPSRGKNEMKRKK